jgi:RHS repeat-associated protein
VVDFVQDMGSTRSVSYVTLGDLRSSDACDGQEVDLNVLESDNGQYGNWHQIGSASAWVGVHMGRVTWQFSPSLTFHVGHGYAFQLYSGDFAPCSVVQGQSWAHNSTTVNAGPGECAVARGGSDDVYRYWHVQGHDDVGDDCPYGYDLKPSNFDPSMPTGWLTVYKPFYSGPIVAQSECQQDGSGNYGTPVDWPGGNGTPVCMFTEFADLGQTPLDGWYYAPIVQSSGGHSADAIRDLYLRLSDEAPAGYDPGSGGGDDSVADNPDATDFAGDGNSGAPNISAGQCHCADPVDPASGNLTESATDLAVSGRGVPLGFARTYNSMYAGLDSARAGRLGPGWAGSYSMHLDVPAVTGDAAIVHNDDGSTVRYTLRASGAFAAPDFVTASLKHSGSGYEYTLENRTAYDFDSDGRLTSVRDRDGYVTTLGYDAQGELTSIASASGRSLSLSYDQGRLQQVTDPLGRQVSYGYDGQGHLTSVTAPGGRVTHYGYDASGRLSSVTDPRGHTTTTTYDSAGRAVTQVGLDGRTTTFDYQDQYTVVTDGDGTKTRLRFDSGQVTHETEAWGTSDERSTDFKYDDARNLIERDDPLGGVTKAAFDAKGRLVKSTDELGRTRQISYDDGGDPVSITDPAGLVTTYTYTDTGDLAEVDRTVGATVLRDRFTYDPDHPGEVTSHRDPSGVVDTYAYDAAGDLTAHTDGDGDKTTYDHNADGWVTSITSPRGNAAGASAADFTEHLDYDGAGRVTRVTDPLGHEADVSYDGDGNRTSVTDALGHTTHFDYDDADRLLKVARPDASAITYHYGTDGSLASVSDGLGHSTSYAYDNLDRLTAETDPDGRSTHDAYDANDRLTSLRDARGEVTSYQYDAAGELTHESYTDPGTHAVSFTYNQRGERTSVTDGIGQSVFTYDALGRLTSSSTPGPIARLAPDLSNPGALGTQEKVDYEYDPAGRITKVSYPSILPDGTSVDTTQAGQRIAVGVRPVVKRRYDDAGRLVEIDDFKDRRFLFAYDADGNLTGAQDPNSTSTAYAFDRAGELMHATTTGPNGAILDLPYQRNANGQITQSAASAALSSTPETFSYDNDGRLTAGTVAATGSLTVGREQETYDNGDRLTSIGIPNAPIALTYDDADQLTKAVVSGANAESATYQFDANGNRTSQTDTVGTSVGYDYDQANRLVRFRNRLSTAATALGSHLSSSLTATTPIDETFRYNGLGQRADLVWDNAEGAAAPILEDKTHLFIYGPGGLPLEIVDLAGNARFYHHDAIGSTRALTDQDGHAVAYSDYSAYGRPLNRIDTALNPIGFAGQYTDAANGLIYMRARWYDPRTGQFLTRDPLGFASGSQNPYGYVEGDPENATDPLGLCSLRTARAAALTQMNQALSMAMFMAASSGSIEGAEFGESEFLVEEDVALSEVDTAAEAAARGEGSYLRTLLSDETGALNPGDSTVNEILEGKLGSIKNAPLPSGSPSWADIGEMKLSEIRAAARAGKPGYRTILKLLTSGRFNKP